MKDLNEIKIYKHPTNTKQNFTVVFTNRVLRHAGSHTICEALISSANPFELKGFAEVSSAYDLDYLGDEIDPLELPPQVQKFLYIHMFS